ncbi:pentatricopeptide repeat-containing protein At1g03100, mitochondrial [Aristolochia californica]|uniref:pentatricopeptide repeat-containing protein At1g03100, mitochondrial n=1 Tax=Aristolochia californica TaxID=171875 RepID=UPI0035DCB4FE
MGIGLTMRYLGRRFPPISVANAAFFFKHGHRCITQVSGYQCWTPMDHLSLCHKLVTIPSSNMLSFKNKLSMMAGNILVQARDPSQLSSELLAAVDDQRFEDAWMLYEKYMQMEGFPRKSVLSKFIGSLAETQKHHWLEKAYSVVETVVNENKFDLLEKRTLIYLSYSLSRSELLVPASIILRNLIEKEEFVPVSAWSGIIAHMSRTPTGAFLAAELVIEIGYFFKDNRVDPRKKCNQLLLSMKPNTTAMGIALIGCLLFGTTRKAEEVLELIPRLGVKPNLTLLIIMAHIYERNGRREEIKKLKRFIDEIPNLGALQLQQYYNCLLSCYLKFGDLGPASELVLEMLRKAKEARTSLAAVTYVLEAVESDKSSTPLLSSTLMPSFETSSDLSPLRLFESPLPSFVEFCTDRNYLSLETEANRLLDGLLAKLQTQVELVTTENGILHATEKTYAKLVNAFLEANKVSDLAEFLIRADKEDSPNSVENSALVHVINACISLGLLDQAYDLLDEMRFAGIRTGSSVYSSLLKAYCKESRSREVQSLLRDARKAGIQLDSTCYEALIESRVIDKDNHGALNLFKEMKEAKISKGGHLEFNKLVKGCSENGEAGLMSKLLAEIKEAQTTDSGVHDWNNVIHFFCKKRLMHDAQKALKKMRALGHQPNAQTFHSLVIGYAALGGKYLEVAELWGEMKVLASSGEVKFDQELLDSLLYCFVRGGFFFRANEVVNMMEKQDLFIDKYKYRILFLKYHKTLYKGKAPKFQTEAQLTRREAALQFKKWIGLGVK